MVSGIAGGIRRALVALLALGLVGIAPTAAAAGPLVDLAWVRRFNGPLNGRDEARFVGADPQGNVIVVGQTYETQYGTENPDIAIVKYDTHGNELWTKPFGSAGSVSDGFKAAAIDQNGDIVVVGSPCGMAKLDPNGDTLWVNPNLVDTYGLAIDSDGNIFVTGTKYEGAVETIKYNPGGDVIWESSYSGGEGTTSSGAAIAVDSSGNVAVTGTINTDTYADILTVLLDADGNVLWERRYNGIANWFDWGTDVAFDPEGNVIVTGQVMEEGYQTDFGTFKYAPDGTLLWWRRYNSSGYSIDEVSQIEVNKNGDIFVAGHSSSGYSIAKYDSGGNQIWERSLPGGGDSRSIPCAIVADPQGNVVFTTTIETQATYQDSVTYMFDPKGNVLWEFEYHYEEARNTDMTVAVALDPEGNVFLTGNGWTSGPSFDFLTLKLRKAQPSRLGLRASDCFVGMKAAFTAVLRDRETLQPLVGKPVRFLFDGKIIADDVLTSENGVARIFYTIPEGTSVGTHSLKARFGGGEGHAMSFHTQPIEVRKGPAKVRVYSKSAGAGQTLVLGARLTDFTGTPLPGRRLKILLAGTLLGTCLTNSLGVGGTQYTVPEGTQTGGYEVRFEFAGDEGHEPVQGVGSLTVG
ncbi:MAG TPA: SBBP repeat-containing protein [Fimbriimonas sp.]